MSTIPGSKTALAFEANIVDHILSSEELQCMWAACRYNILISISEMANSIDSDNTTGSSDRITCQKPTLDSKQGARMIGNIHVSNKTISKRFKVLWNPDLRIRRARRGCRQELDIYGKLIDSDSLVIPKESAYRLLQARLIDQAQFNRSVTLAQEIEKAKRMLTSILHDCDTIYIRDSIAKVDQFCSDIQACLEDILGKDKEVTSIFATEIRRALLSASGIPFLASSRITINNDIDTGLIMHCGNYVLDPMLMLLWKMTGNTVCDYTHAYAGAGHIAYTHRPELISLPTYSALMPDVTVGGLHMWKPSVSGEIVIDIDSVTEWARTYKWKTRRVNKPSIKILFVSIGQLSKKRREVYNFLNQLAARIDTQYASKGIHSELNIRVHPKEITKQELLRQEPIENELREADIVIGEFSTCLLQAEDQGKVTVTIATDLQPDVYTSINTILVRGYTREDADIAACSICLYIERLFLR